MPTRNRFQLGGPLGGYVAGLETAAELALSRTQAQKVGFEAQNLAEQNELLKGQRREWESNVDLRRAERLAGLRGTTLQNEALAYDLAEARRTQNLKDAIAIANLDATRTRTGAEAYALSDAMRTQDMRDAQKIANLQSTQAATQASEMATIQGVASYREYIAGAKQRAAERRAAVAEAGAREKTVARRMQNEVRNAELTREINEFKLRVIQDDNKLDNEIKDLTVLLAKKDQQSFEQYKTVTDDPYLQRYESIEDPQAKNYLNRKLHALLMDPKTKRQVILNTAKSINSRSTVKQIQDQLLLDVFTKGPGTVMNDENKFWFMMFSRAGIPNDPLAPMMWDKMRGMVIGGNKNPAPTPTEPPPGSLAPPPPEQLTAEDIEAIEGAGRQRAYDGIYGAGAFERAKERVNYKPERDEPTALKDQGPGFGERLAQTLTATPEGAYSYEDLQRDLGQFGRDFNSGDLIRIF